MNDIDGLRVRLKVEDGKLVIQLYESTDFGDRIIDWDSIDLSDLIVSE